MQEYRAVQKDAYAIAYIHIPIVAIPMLLSPSGVVAKYNWAIKWSDASMITIYIYIY